MFLPDNIDLGQSDKYILSIRISSSLFSYSIHEPKVGGDFCYREVSIPKGSDFLTEIQSIVFDNNFLTNKFKKTNIVLVSKEYELVPEYVLEKGKEKALYNFTTQKKSEQVLQSIESFQDNNILFGCNEELYTFFMRSLFNPQFIPHSFLGLKYFAEKSRSSSNQNKIFLYFHHDFVDLFCYNETSKITQVQSYQNENELNLVYYILNIWNKLNFNQKKDILYFSGTSKENQMIKILSDYIKHIENIEYPNETDFLNIENRTIVPIDLLILSTL